MAQRSDREIYVMRHLQKFWMGGFPLSNLVAGSPIPAKDLQDTLEKLAEDKMITLKGPATLADLRKLVDAAGDIDPPEMSDAKGSSWKGNNVLVFDGPREGRPDFFRTDVRLTLRGHATLAFEKKKPTPPQVAAKRKPASSPKL